MKVSFFLGKGGVGKTTLSLLYAIENKDKKLALVSLDKAHNLKDALIHFSDKDIKHILIEEVDIEKEIENYLERKKKEIESKFSFFSIYNLDMFFKNLKHAPGIEEEIYLHIIEKKIKDYKSYDIIYFDMPPTALSLRILSLPNINLAFIDFLKDIRKKIFERKKLINQIKDDKVLKKLEKLQVFYLFLNKLIKSSNINIILNLDPLSFRETNLILKKLKEFNFNFNLIYLIINKVKENVDIDTIIDFATKYNCEEIINFIKINPSNIKIQKYLEFV